MRKFLKFALYVLLGLVILGLALGWAFAPRTVEKIVKETVVVEKEVTGVPTMTPTPDRVAQLEATIVAMTNPVTPTPIVVQSQAGVSSTVTVNVVGTITPTPTSSVSAELTLSAVAKVAAVPAKAAVEPVFPQTAREFARLVGLSCPPDAPASCIDLREHLEQLVPTYGEDGKTVIAWSWVREGNHSMWDVTYIRNIWSYMQNGYMHDPSQRGACGLTLAEVSKFGLDPKRDVGAGIPAGFTGPVEGLYFWSGEPLPGISQSMEERCK